MVKARDKVWEHWINWQEHQKIQHRQNANIVVTGWLQTYNCQSFSKKQNKVLRLIAPVVYGIIYPCAAKLCEIVTTNMTKHAQFALTFFQNCDLSDVMMLWNAIVGKQNSKFWVMAKKQQHCKRCWNNGYAHICWKVSHPVVQSQASCFAISISSIQGSHSFTDKKNPGHFQDPHQKFSGSFSEPANV